MAFTQADLDALDAAIKGGGVISQMSFGEQSFTFRSLDDMLKLRAVMRREVEGGSGTRYGAVCKGA